VWIAYIIELMRISVDRMPTRTDVDPSVDRTDLHDRSAVSDTIMTA
jgi:hypothetical protein